LLQVKTRAHETVFGQSSSTIVHSVVRETGDVHAPPASRPSENSLTRTANRVRKESRPSDPVDLNFEVSNVSFVLFYLNIKVI